MTWSLSSVRIVFGLALASLVIGCPKEPNAPSPKESSVDHGQAEGPSGATSTSALEGAVRRPRAPLEGSPEMPITASNRPRAAEFIRVEDVAKAPPLRNDGPFSRAASLVHFIEETWLKAINNTDSDAYLALLDPRFSAFVQQKDAQPSVITREQWPAERKPPLGTGTALGPVDVVFLPDPEHKADVTLWERTTANAACQINQRTLTLAQQLNAEGEPDGPWTIRRESISASRSCEKSDLGGVLKTHRRLVAAWKMSDSSTLSELASGEFLHRDAGVEVERYDLDALTQGEGRWVMEVLAESAATEDDIEQYGDRAVLRLGSTHRVVYGRRGETWRLMGLYRHPAAQPK